MRLVLCCPLLIASGCPTPVVECTDGLLRTTEADVCALTTCDALQGVLNEVHSANESCSESECVVAVESLDFTCDCGRAMATSGNVDVATIRARWDALDCDPDCGPDGADCGFCDCAPPTGAVCDPKTSMCAPIWDD